MGDVAGSNSVKTSSDDTGAAPEQRLSGRLRIRLLHARSALVSGTAAATARPASTASSTVAAAHTPCPDTQPIRTFARPVQAPPGPQPSSPLLQSASVSSGFLSARYVATSIEEQGKGSSVMQDLQGQRRECRDAGGIAREECQCVHDQGVRTVMGDVAGSNTVKTSSDDTGAAPEQRLSGRLRIRLLRARSAPVSGAAAATAHPASTASSTAAAAHAPCPDTPTHPRLRAAGASPSRATAVVVAAAAVGTSLQRLLLCAQQLPLRALRRRLD